MAAVVATEALKRIAELYEIEAEIRGKSAEERLAMGDYIANYMKLIGKLTGRE